eukprot:923083-Prymnesium_polylepis.1
MLRRSCGARRGYESEGERESAARKARLRSERANGGARSVCVARSVGVRCRWSSVGRNPCSATEHRNYRPHSQDSM